MVTPTPEYQRIAEPLTTEWKAHRLIPRLFDAAGQLRTQVADGARPFGFTELYPTEWITRSTGAPIWRQLGKDLAVGEVREFFDTIEALSTTRAATGALVDQVSVVAAELDAHRQGGAIFAPARWRVLRELDLQGRPGTPADPRALGSPWYRGSFEDIPVFSVPMSPRRALWIVQFRSLGSWNTSRAVDYLDVRLDLLPGRSVPLNGHPVPATSITAEEYFAIEIDDPRAAAGIALSPEPEVETT
jgi:hypothetical protein